MSQRDLDNLFRIRFFNDRIAKRLERVEELRQSAIYGAKIMDDIGGSHAQPVNRLEIIMAQMDAEERRADELIDKRYDITAKVVKAIQAAIEDTARRHILYLRYLAVKGGRCLEWQEVIDQVNKYHNISRSRVFQLHHIALVKLRVYNI